MVHFQNELNVNWLTHDNPNADIVTYINKGNVTHIEKGTQLIKRGKNTVLALFGLLITTYIALSTYCVVKSTYTWALFLFSLPFAILLLIPLLSIRRTLTTVHFSSGRSTSYIEDNRFELV